MTQYPGRQFFFLCILLLFFVPNTLALETQYHKITAPEVKGMMKTDNVLIINTLSKLEFEMQHIPGSINIPINTLQTPDILPEDKSTPLIFYCMARL